MPADASIYSQIQPVQQGNRLADMAQLMQIQGAQGQNALAQYGLRKAQRGDEETNALADAIRGGLDLNTPEGQSQAFGLAPTIAPGYIKTNLEQQHLRSQIKSEGAKTGHLTAQTGQVEADTHAKMVAHLGGAMGALINVPGVTPEHVIASIQAAAKTYGVPDAAVQQAIAQVPKDAAGLPDYLKAKNAELMTPKERMAYVAPDANTVANNTTSLATNAATNATSSANNAATNATSRANNAATIAGENTRHAATLTDGKTQVVQTDNGPVLVNKADGTGKAVTGPDGKQLTGVTKALTDTQAKSLLFGSRMEAADKILGQLANEGTTTSIPGSRTPIIGGTISALSSENRQMLDQAKRDFMTAVLRRESGAAISSGEFDTADKQYFPQIGDSDKVKAQKDANRKMAIRGVLVEVPEKQRTSLQAPTTTPAAGPKAGTVQDGYRFKGGNPADRNSWEKV